MKGLDSMPTTIDKVSDDALSLSLIDRIVLVEKLLQSLNPPDQPEIERLWEKEVERRVAEIENGETELIPGEQVFSEIRQKYSR